MSGLPILAGLSRKSMLGGITGRSVEERLPASLAAAVMALAGGRAFCAFTTWQQRVMRWQYGRLYATSKMTFY